MTRFEYRLPIDRAEIDRFARIASRALFFQEPAGDWIDEEGPDNFRMMLVDGELVGGMSHQLIGHFFGGRVVLGGAVRCVAIRSDARAGGVATEMMRANLQELRELGAPIATLYPSTHRLYRRAGYEIAGSRLQWQLAIPLLEVRDRTLTVRAGSVDELPLLKELYTAAARDVPGCLDRTDWIWRRTLNVRPEAEPHSIWFFEGKDGPEGYAVTATKGSWKGSDPPRMVLADRVWRTPAAGRRLLTFFADHRSMFQHVGFASGPSEPLLHLIPQYAYELKESHCWMLRLIDVGAAMEARGFAPGRSGRLALDVRDDFLGDNQGPVVLDVSDGRATATRGGDGTLQADVRGLSALYTGHSSAFDLRAAGLMSGPDEAVALADSLFAGPAPWMADAF